MSRAGLLLVNLGTPASPKPGDVRRYLRQFLSDPRVLDVAAWKRWLVLRLFILPFRPRRSGEAYEKIWTLEGSPLLVLGQALAAAVRARLGAEVPVELGMRYGEPSIEGAMQRLIDAGAERIVVLPLFPQYSSSSTGSTLEEVFRVAARRWNVPYIQVVPPFYDAPAFLAASALAIRPTLERVRPEAVFFSFHGLPERHVRKSDATGAHCLGSADCCERIVEANRHCYRAQCVATARRLGDLLEIPAERRRICFQSRLGRDPWLRPYTDEVLVDAARNGMRRAVIVSPAFVTDCLETLEELGLRAAESWRDHGGDLLELAPSLNASDAWADAVVSICLEHAPSLAPASVAPAAPAAANR